MCRSTETTCFLRVAFFYQCAAVEESRMRRADDALLELPGQDKLCVLALRVASADQVENLWSSGNILHKTGSCQPQVQSAPEEPHFFPKCATGCHYPVLGRYLTNSGSQNKSMSTRMR